MKVEVYADADAVANKAAGLIATMARDAVADRGRFVMAVSGGHTPWQMLRALAREDLPWEGLHRVVSMPSWDIFEHQSKEYRDSVLPPGVKARLAIEQASTFGWERYVGDAGRVIGMETFGASAPLKELQNKFGFEPDRVVATVKEMLGKK